MVILCSYIAFFLFFNTSTIIVVTIRICTLKYIIIQIISTKYIFHSQLRQNIKATLLYIFFAIFKAQYMLFVIVTSILIILL